MKLEFISAGGGSSGGSASLPYTIFSCSLSYTGGGQPPNHLVLEATFFVGNTFSASGSCIWSGIEVINSTSFTLTTQENNVPVRQDGLFSRTLLEIKQFS